MPTYLAGPSVAFIKSRQICPVCASMRVVADESQLQDQPTTRGLLLLSTSSGLGPSHTRRDPVGNLMEPRSKGLSHPQSPSLFDQDQKGSLKSILGVVSVAEHHLADAEHHRPVAINQDRECQLSGLVPPGGEQPSSCASVSPPAAPTINRVSRCRRAMPCICLGHEKPVPPCVSPFMMVMSREGPACPDYSEILRSPLRGAELSSLKR